MHQEPIILIPPLLVSCGGCYESPHIWWLKTTEMYSLTVQETTSLKSALLGQNQGWQGHTVSRGSRGESSVP